MTSPTPAPTWLKASAIGVGVLILLWLPREDTHTNYVLLFALCISALLALHATLRRPAPRQPIAHASIIGLLAGTAITPLALIIIAAKTGLHSHAGVPDFTTQQIIAMLHMTPYFAAGGLLVGVGTGIWQQFKPNH